MGFFSTNEHANLYRSFEFPVVEGYDDTVGCGLALIEGYQNDLALFSAAVVSDLNEMAAIHEGADVEALQEASISGMMESIKQFFVKLGAKIKAIFTGFMAKLESYFTKDLKAYVKKYENSLSGKDFKDMKVKYMPLKADGYTVPSVYNPSKYSFGFSATYTKSDNVANKEYEDLERSDLIKEVYHKMADNSVDTNSDFDEWYHDQLFGDSETKDDWDYTKVKAIAARLTDNAKCIKNIKTFYDKIQDGIKKVIKEIDAEDKRLNALWKDSKDGKAATGQTFNVRAERDNGDYTGASSISTSSTQNKASNSLNVATKEVSIMRQKASAYQDVTTHVSQVVMKEAKVAIAQDKKVFAAAVAYKKATKEEALLDMIAECAYDETMEDLDRPFTAA